MNSFIARQPIFDIRQHVYAYELLYRANSTTNAFNPEVDQNRASSEIMIESFLGMGLEKLTGSCRAFINFTESLLTQNVATLFPREQLVIELLETISPTDEIIESCRYLKEKGYTLALDDFVFSPEFLPLMDLADIIKIDFLASSIDEIKAIMRNVNRNKTKLLAEKIETQEMFDIAKNMGFSYFQGYFFSKPVILSDKKLEPLKLNYLRLIRYVHQPNMDFPKVAKAIRTDMVLTYKLLRLVNSAYFGMRNEIKDIQHALAILGTRETKKWVTLITMMGIHDGKPEETIRMSMVRGRFLEVMGADIDLGVKGEALYTTGLFSLIDVITEQPKEQVIEQLNLPKPIKSALLNGVGDLARALDIIANYERGKWDEAMKFAYPFGITSDDIIRYYFDSLSWCNNMFVL